MKTLKIFSALFLFMLMIVSCRDEVPTLGTLPDKSEMKFEVKQDLVADPGGNTIILRNLTPGTEAIWDYGTGKSYKMTDTIHVAFKGSYTVKFTALTGAGLVACDPVTVNVTANNLNYVSDPLWTALTGGVGKEKTWYLDLNADGVSKYYGGPLSFFGTEDSWTTVEMLAAGKSYEVIKSELGITDAWNWQPAWKDNTWLLGAADFGSMTFSLKNGAFITVNHKTIAARGTENGTYLLDATKHTLTINDAAILHDSNRDGQVTKWGDIKVLSLTADHMQLAVLRDNSSEGKCLLVYNFISKDYSDNWTPPVSKPTIDEGYNPTFKSGELLNMLAGGSGQARRWKLDAGGNPVDWIGHGTGWTKNAASSSSWGWNDEWTAIANNSWIQFDRFGGAQNYTRNQNGVVTTGTFTINESGNEVTLTDNTLIQNSNSGLNPTTNTIKVVKGFPTSYYTKGVWFGTSYNDSKDEWVVFHYVIN